MALSPLLFRLRFAADQRTTSKGEVMTTDSISMSPKRVARITGIFYLLVGIFGFFSEGFADPLLYVAGNAAATAGNVVANQGLVRMDVVAHLLDATFFVLTAVGLYVLLKHVNKTVAGTFVVLVSLAAGIIGLNAIFMFAGLRVATDGAYAAAFGTAGSNALVLLVLDMQHYGTLAAQVFFGLWLAPLGYLAYKSGMFPKGLGIVLVLASVSYLVDVLGAFLLPDLSKEIHGLAIITPAIAEPWMVLYLLVKGVRSSIPTGRASATAASPVPSPI
jgi:hypothetical protein